MKSLLGRLLLVACLACAGSGAALAQDTTSAATPAATPDGGQEWHHGLSLFGDLKYGPDFKHFDYVNPDAPKAGKLRQSAIGTFDTLNPFNIKGTPAAGLGLLYDTLMTSSLDEPSSEYGLVAESATYPDDYSSVTYRLRPEARFHDGTPVTPEDVVWSFETLKKSHPFYNAYYHNVVKAEKTGEHEVTFTFDQKGNRELPQITGQIYVMPKHWWEANGPDGKPRDFGSSTLEPPLTSGPYEIKAVDPGRSITYQRVDDYWGKDLPVNVGSYNFEELTYEYYRDMTVALEAFKADRFDFRAENSAKRWATEYDFPAVRRGDVVLEKFQTKQAEPMQGLVFNLRREKFQDPRVREAFDLAYDFEWLNENIFYGQYTRTDSYFANTDLAAKGLPTGKELEILDKVRDEVPPEVFTKPYENPVGGDRRKVRANLEKADELLKRGRLGRQERQARQREDRRAADGGVPERPAGHGACARALHPEPQPARHPGDDPHRRHVAVPEPDGQLQFRHDDRGVPAVAVARQRAARVLGLGGGRQARQPQRHRHQEPGRRQAGRRGDLCQGPRDARRGDPGARPGALVEPLPRAAILHARHPHRALGPLRPAQGHARLRLQPDDLVVGRRQGGEDPEWLVSPAWRRSGRPDAAS